MGVEIKKDLSTMQQLQTKLIVGLGNIGPDYTFTRHNMGFLLVDDYVEQHSLQSFSDKSQLSALVSENVIAGTKVIFAKPTTLMNRSGQALQQLQNYFNLGLDQILIVHDDIDLDFGTIRTKVGGSSGGHNGIKSIDMIIGEEYGRVRVGVSDELKEKIETGDYVLQRIPKKLLNDLPDISKSVDSHISAFIEGSFESTSITINT